MFERCFWQHLVLFSVVVWGVPYSEINCGCDVCPEFKDQDDRCKCCVWYYYGKRDAEANIRSDPSTKSARKRSVEKNVEDDEDEDAYFGDTPCLSSRHDFSWPPRISFTISLQKIKQTLRCLLWLKKIQSKGETLFSNNKNC